MKKVIFLSQIPPVKSFTLVELIIVVIIVGILAAVGLTQYNLVVEKSRLAEAKIYIGVMRDLAYQYYLENGSLAGIQTADVQADQTYTSDRYYGYWLGTRSATFVCLVAFRATSGGKLPNASRGYQYYVNYEPGTGQCTWHCRYSDDSSSCFGLPP